MCVPKQQKPIRSSRPINIFSVGCLFPVYYFEEEHPVGIANRATKDHSVLLYKPSESLPQIGQVTRTRCVDIATGVRPF